MYRDEESLYFKEYGKCLNKSEALILGQMVTAMGVPVVYGLGLFNNDPIEENLPQYRE
ncbi:hypothetical protein ABFP60_15360 [Clostridioides difficile]